MSGLTSKVPGIFTGIDWANGKDETVFFCLPYLPRMSEWSGNDNRPTPREPTDNRGVWADHPAMREALDRLGEAIGQTVDMHRSGRTWRLRHGLMDLPEHPSFWHALRAGLEEIAEVVGSGEPWAKPDLLDALSEAYAMAGGRWWRIQPKGVE